MKVTGYTLREAIKENELKLDTASGAFNPALRVFPGDAPKQPQKVAEQLEAAEKAVVKLQVAQMRYNLMVTVEVLGERMTLAEAIKRVGGAGRIEKMWKSAIQEKTRNSYLDNDDVRDPNQVRASRTVTSDEAMNLARIAGKKANALRAAIATANGREVEIEDLDSSLFG